MTHLTEDDVRQIRRMRADKVPIKEVAAKFGISEGTVSRIANRMAWGHVP